MNGQKNTKRYLRWMGPLTVLAVFIWGSYAHTNYVTTPYLGFEFHHRSGEISKIFDKEVSRGLQEGDTLVEINGVDYSEYVTHPWINYLSDVQTGDVLELVVSREGVSEPILVEWEIGGPQAGTYLLRLQDAGPLGALFLVMGAYTFFSVRPKDFRWAQFQLFCYLTALMLITSGPLARLHIQGAFYVSIFVSWLWVANTIHLHWSFPRPLRRGEGLIAALYRVCIGLALFELVFPALAFDNLRNIQIGLTVGISMGLLLIHNKVDYQYRAVLQVMIWGVGLSFTMLFVFYWISTLEWAPENLPGGELLSLPLLPGVYLFAIFNRRLPSELQLGLADPREEVFKRIMRLIARADSMEEMATSIRYEFSRNISVQCLAVLRVNNGQAVDWVFETMEVSAEAPDERELAGLMAGMGRNLTEDELADLPERLEWVRLVLPLELNQELIGLWLLGPRGPETPYSYRLIDSLQSLAHQISLAVVALERSDQLRDLIQRNIAQQETESANLSHFLHDGVVNDLTLIKRQMQATELAEQIDQVIRNLRSNLIHPSDGLLDYGLSMALEDWLLDIDGRYPEVKIQSNLPVLDDGLPRSVSEQFLRVAQQACNNAIRHGNPTQIDVMVNVASDEVALVVEDDGVGFDASPVNMLRLTREKHFGLQTMQERATLIKANLSIDSNPGAGTRVELHWKAE